ncbi:MAG: SRPBCC family protein [Deltaproteobacteria bacterium]|nr:SRPBCC family protein [Deltaproteobacteria bacterium]
MLKKILIAVAVVVVAFLGFVATRPPTYHVERSAVIHAPPEVVFALVNNVANRHTWYPWDRLDPAMKLEYGDKKEGVGATYHWKGNDDVGEGRQTITESVANQKVVDKLEFLEPFPSTPVATFTLVPDGAHTRLTWSLDGTNNYVGKLFGLFMDMDQMIGKDFEQGLKFLDDAAMTRAKGLAGEGPAPGAALPAPVAADAAKGG